MAASPFDELAHTLSFVVSTKVVHHHYLPALQIQDEHLLNVGFKDHGGGRGFHTQGRPIPWSAHTRKHIRVSSPVSRLRSVGLLPFGAQAYMADNEVIVLISRAAWAFDIPPFIAATIFLRRSSE